MEHIAENIVRLRVPFDDLYTSVFIATTDNGAAILDCATTREDVERYILPALAERKITPTLILVSHHHGDHMGGLPFLAAHFPNAEISVFDPARVKNCPGRRVRALQDGELLLGCLRIIHLPGHSSDSVAVLDERTHVLLSFDCFQASGISRYGTSIYNVADYINSIKKIRSKRMDILVASHKYVPVGDIARGEQEITRYLDASTDALNCLLCFAEQNAALSPAEMADKFNAEHPHHPTVSRFTMSAIPEYQNGT